MKAGRLKSVRKYIGYEGGGRKIITLLGHRVTPVFFVWLILASIGGPLAVDYYRSKLSHSHESITTDDPNNPSRINPSYKDPRVNSAKKTKILATAKPKQLDSQYGSVSEAAKKTAVSSIDPVEATQEQRELSSKPPDQLTKPQLQDRLAAQSKVMTDQEVKSKRTAFSQTFKNNQGGETRRIYSQPVNYKKNNQWVPIAGTLKDDLTYNQANKPKESLWQRLLPGKPELKKKGLTQEDGLLKMAFRPLGNDEQSLIFKTDGGTQISVAPLNANAGLNPSMQQAKGGKRYVQYINAWKDTDLYYEQRGSALKEFLMIKSAKVNSKFSFKIRGGSLSYGKDKDGKSDGTIILKTADGKAYLLPQLTVTSKQSGPISDPKLKYELDGQVVSIIIDPDWLKQQPAASFPLVIDPSYITGYYSTGIPGGDYGQFIAYKSDGYSCDSNNCDMNVGTLYNSGVGYRTWRTMMHLPLMDVYGKTVHSASIYTEMEDRPYGWHGYGGNRPYWVNWAQCFGYECRSGSPAAFGYIDGSGTLDATGLMQWLAANQPGDAWLEMWGDEGDAYSYKAFSGGDTYLDVAYVHWNQSPNVPSLSDPADKAVITYSRPTLAVNGVSDPDGDTIHYAFHLMDSRGNIIAHSGEIDSTWWTIPDNVLTDGESYQWRAWILERSRIDNQVIVDWRPTEIRSFTFDLRTGKDKTQTFDDVGPFSVSLNKGNGYTGMSSHSISALGGNIGIGLDYNTPDLSQQGLTATYYNDINGEHKKAITVIDQNPDFDWGTGSPYPGSVQSDWFSVNWQGYFIAPMDGEYNFGGLVDDTMTVDINGTHFGWPGYGWNWSSATTTLKKGQAYPISIWFSEATGPAYAHLQIRLPNGAEQRLPREWLRTLPDVTAGDNQGLSAKFYKNYDPAGNPNYELRDNTPLVFATKVPSVSIDWGVGSLVPYDVGVFNDNMMVVYNGYVTIPVSGDYKFGGGSDDGLNIKLGGRSVVSDWSQHPLYEIWSAPMHFEAGQIIPIEVDYYEAYGGAAVNLQWDGPAGKGVITGSALSTKPRVVPRGWNLSIDADGNIPYETLNVKSSGNAELQDSNGFVHIYTWTGSGFKPPVNEDGYLVRNEDASYTLTDVDGRVYNFSADGIITSITSPVDDRNPSALKYEYRNTTTEAYTALPKLSKIIDSVDPSRYGQLYYWNEQGSDSVCSVPDGFEAPPAGFLCAFKTFPNGYVTKFYYKGGQLARIEQPGNALTDYGYDDTGRVTSLRDTAANDALLAGLRTADGTETTQMQYDFMARVSKVTAPAPFGSSVPTGQSNSRAEHIFDYDFQSTKRHVTGAPEPNGYLAYIEYDNLFRTTKSCDNLGLCATNEWHPTKDLLLSSTDNKGLKSTTIFDDNDLPVAEYGPAPASWFDAASRLPKTDDSGTDRTPLVPRSETRYDEGMLGPAVAWYGARGQSLFGAPQLHTTGFDSAEPAHMGRDFRSAVAPITTNDLTPGYGFSATGKIKLPASGTYTFRVYHDDGVRLSIDDSLIIDNWKTRTDGINQNSPEGSFTAEAGKSYRFRFDYIHFDDGTGPGGLELWLRGPGIPDTNAGLGTSRLGDYLIPAYGLVTSSTDFDKDLGNTIIKNTYKDPAYGLLAQTQLDPNGLALSTKSTYEDQGSGYFRQLSKSLPAGTATNYTYYGATEIIDNPCTAESDPASQAGRLKSRVEPDPDGAGPLTGRTVQNIYDSEGRVVANRQGAEAWTCTSYDSRGRIIKVVVPDFKNAAGAIVRKGKTLINNYSFGGNPFVTTIQDETGGYILNETDLLGRVIRYRDQRGFVTQSYYDNLSRLIKRTGKGGTEEYLYNDLGQLIAQKLDGKQLAAISYNGEGKVDKVDVSAIPGLSLAGQKYDDYDRMIGQQYTLPTQNDDRSNSITEEVGRAVSGDILRASVNGIGISTGDNQWASLDSYSYDAANRLTSVQIGGNLFEYGFGAQDTTTCKGKIINPDAYKNSNRTLYKWSTDGTLKQQVNYCYDFADRLLKTSDSKVGMPIYDDHGNITRLGSLASTADPSKADQVFTIFGYDNADRNMAIRQGSNTINYVRDGQGRITRTAETQILNSASVTTPYNYGYTSSGDTPDFLTDASNKLIENYLPLPGGILLTYRPTKTTQADKYVVSLSNLHGDIMAALDGNGQILKGIELYSPFGEKIAPSSQFMAKLTASSDPNAQALAKLLDTSLDLVSNKTNASSYGWLGQHQKQSEMLFSLRPIQMGSRVYIPSLGRFLQNDPVEGGSDNNYVYVLDPINDFDLDGNISWKTIAKIGVVAGGFVAGAAFCAGTAGVGCVVLASAAVGAASGAANSTIDQVGNGKKFSWGAIKHSAVVGGVAGGVSGGVASRSGPLLANFGKRAGSQAPRLSKSGVYITRTTSGKIYVGKATNLAARAKQHAATGKINIRTPRIVIFVKSPRLRSFTERAAYHILGGKRAPWLDNKIRPPWR